MRKNKPIYDDFIASAKVMSENSLNLENIGIREDIGEVGLWDNIIIDRYLPIIKNTSKIITLPTSESSRYYGDPKRLSLDYFGVTDYWWVILIINEYNSVYDFVGWNSILVPDIGVVDSIVTEIESNRKKEA